MEEIRVRFGSGDELFSRMMRYITIVKNSCVVSTLFFVVVVNALSVRTYGQDTLATRVEEFVKATIQKQQIPGLSLAVVKNGQVVLAKGFGYANLEHQVPATPDTVFQIASIGKQFTATAVMMLVEQGKLGLDDKVSKYLPDTPGPWARITVRHLLTHTSGLGGFPEGFDYRRDYTEDELFKIIQSQPVAFAPGEKWQYSNAGYVTLGVLIRKITGKPFSDFIGDNIFKPLDMNTARLVSDASIIPHRAAGYTLFDGRLVNQPWMSPTTNRTADSGWYMSVLDLAKWDAALYGEKILKRDSLAQMFTPVTLTSGKSEPYGFGWYITDVKGHRLIEHEGAWPGVNANIARYIDDTLTVIILTNIKTAGAPRLSHGVAGIYLPAVAPNYYAKIEDKEPQVTAFARQLMNSISRGTVDQKLFTTQARAVFFPDTAKMYENYLKPTGEVVNVQLVERADTRDGKLYRWEFFYKSVTLLVSITLDKDGKIVAIEAVDNY